MSSPYAATVSKKREIRDQSIKEFLDAGLSADKALTSINDVSELASLIADGKATAYDVTVAYIHKAVAAQEKTNCLTEILFRDALEQAKVLDEYQKQHGKTVGPLHGVPMSLKDQFNVKGYDTTLGYVGRAFKPATDDAVLVKILKRAGAIFVAKTNLPQSIMWCETESAVWGLTTHPSASKFTPGGSTGGEGSLIAMHGSLFGWGTDLGGSVRIPSHMVGLYGFKPSSARLPYEGVPVSTEGQEHVPSAIGPLARSLSSIQVVMKQILDAQPWRDDPRVDPRPWDEQAYQAIQTRPLVVGLLVDDGAVKIHPSIERVLRGVAAKLQEAGHEVISWPSDGLGECIKIMDQYYTADGGEDIRKDVTAGGEPFFPHVQSLVDRAPAISVYEYWQVHRGKRAAQLDYLKIWQRNVHPTSGKEADILLTPVMPHAAVPHRTCKWVGYTKAWNVLDYPALVVPAGHVDAAIDSPKTDPSVTAYAPRNQVDKWNWELYDPQESDGMPIGIQLIAQKLQEEKLFGAAKSVEKALGR